VIALRPSRSALPGWFALLLAAGCSGPAPPPTPDKGEALAALRTALEAWQRGDKPDAHKNRQPPIQVIDPSWSQGTKLARFEIEADQAGPSGFDLGCPVKLWLGDKKDPLRVKYTIATTPAVVVARDFGG
jgi:hypothetical protein